MTVEFSKDRWIVDAISSRYLVVQKDGTVLRCRAALRDGTLMSADYVKIPQRVHKATGRVVLDFTWRGIKKTVLVNRIVALRFLPNPQNLPQVNHIDGNKENNALSNLEWSSGSDNERHAHRTGLKSGRGSANSNAKLTAEQVAEIRESRDTPVELAFRFGVGVSTIVNIRNRKTWKHV